MQIIGISAFYHDAAACLLRDGQLICAVEEERLSRNKHDSGFPWQAIRYCLSRVKTTLDEIDAIAFYEDPVLKLSRQLWTGLRTEADAGIRAKVLARLDPGFVARQVREVGGYEGPLDIVTHHEAHAASAYYYSGFDEAAIMTFDGVGEWATSSYARGQGSKLDLFEQVDFPHSLGLLYSAITSYLGFEVNEGEYKVMGLAPYGAPRYVSEVKKLVELRGGGQFALDMSYFDFLKTNRMYSPKLVDLFGRAPRERESNIEQFHQDIAHSLQVVLEDILLDKARHLHREAPSENLCMAGGVALNCVANGRILREGPFKRLFVQPSAGDAGASLGAAALSYARRTNERPMKGGLRHVYLGPAADNDDIARILKATGVEAIDLRGRPDDLVDAVADRLASGKVIGWLSGGMEFGPRALGGRSILGDPRDPEMRDRINALVKKREAFRPFAPAVLASEAAAHFELDHPSPFMLETCQVRSNLDLPAITHVNGSARVQTVDGTGNPRFARLLERFHAKTGCPILLNTSFNVRGEPIVNTPEDAIRCFANSKIDCLVLEDFIIDRAAMPEHWEPAVAALFTISGPQLEESVYIML